MDEKKKEETTFIIYQSACGEKRMLSPHLSHISSCDMKLHTSHLYVQLQAAFSATTGA